MADDQSPDRRDNSGLYDAIEGLRDDVREDIGHLRDDVREDNERLEGRVMTAIEDVRRDAAEFALAHARVHTARQEETDAEHATFRTFVRNAELAQARRDGALGVFRFTVELVSRQWKPLTALLGGVATVAAIVSGAIQVDVAIR